MDEDLPPHDIAAEQIILGACMWSRAALDHARNHGITAATWFRPAHITIWQVLLTQHILGSPSDPIAVKNELEQRHLLPKCGGAGYLIELYERGGTATPEQIPYYAGIITARARARDTLALATRLHQIATDGDPDYDKAREYVDDWLVDGRTATTAHQPLELEEFLAQADDDHTYDWVIPGLIERHDRLILTGPEGGGKSTLLRQIAIQAASGVHPVTGELYDPQKVLYVDLENSPAQVRRKLRPLRLAAGELYQPGRLHLEIRAEGIDLTGPADREWLAGVARAVQPDLIVIGPLYKAANGDPTEEKSSKPVAVTLDALRMELGAALLIEAHASKTMHGTKRAIEPYGWSGWLRWPEFGIHISPEGEIKHWRGQRDEREWPTLMKRGGEWPWTPERDKNEALWRRIKQVRQEFGEQMSYRDLTAALSASMGAVQRAVANHKNEWLTINGGDA